MEIKTMDYEQFEKVANVLSDGNRINIIKHISISNN